jgi:hypothetical protein
LINQWKPNTQVAKEIAVRAFFKFLKALGTEKRFFPEDGSVPEKTISHTRDEEHALCQFAMLRMTAGQNIGGVEGVIANIRTWYRFIYDEEFGKVGRQGRKSMTSQYLKSMQAYFPPLESLDKRRDPVTWPMVTMFMTEAKNQKWWDVGVAIAVAFAALLRMGEATNTDQRAFDAAEDLAEKHVLFLPTFWQADRVVIQLGRTKTDQTGAKARQQPRVIPLDGDSATPGHLLRDMLIRRYCLRPGENPVLGNAPLFQDRKGGQLKRDAVLKFMRATLRAAGATEDKIAKIGTHSCRIGGATRLFQLGATAEVLKKFGGWVSDAWKVYVHIEQIDLMKFTRAMCR